ncbi:hypothetical protein NDK47_26420 [Brevibacillus ruminantium]|uniref:DUF4367 domain-containing protein n=1 Tax=Brevibacillus ruminantium TaxID=2950604 RepID=A0ABY4WEI8_9BACL|nr:hypothetical protein [Brevibacillus ruminantium]USG65593.1 hypothetical protein NDK47_26420 [Brevibacillus ruminantium]
MKHIEPYDDFEKRLKNTPVPQIHIKDQVLDRLRERNNQKEAVRVKKKIGLIVAACLVFGVTSAYAAVKVYELKNEKGEVISQISHTTEKPVLDKQRTYYELLEEVRETVKPGGAVAVYIVPDNPQKRISFFQKPMSFEDRSAFLESVGGGLTFPEELVGGYKFTEGMYQNELIRDYKNEDFYKEAEETKKDVIVKELAVEPDYQYAIARYAKDKGTVSIKIDNFAKVKNSSTEAGPDDTVEKVKVKNKDALYLMRKFMGEDGKVASIEQSIEFYKDDAKQLYTVFTTSDKITKEEMLAIAEKLE